MKRILLLVFATLSLVCSAHTSKITRERVDSLKLAIPYPMHNIGDTLFVAFINNPEVATDAVRPSDVEVLKVRIVDMMLYNSIGGKGFTNGVFLDVPHEEFPLRWQYQFLDAFLPNPKYGDRSDFYDEDVFFSNPMDAKKSLLSK